MSELTRDRVTAVKKAVDEFYQVQDGSGRDRYQNLRRPRKLKFYVNGDRYFRGKKIFITPSRYYNFHDLLNDLTGKLPLNLNLHYGVRQIFTPHGGRKIFNIGDLIEGEEYVCAGFEGFKMIEYGGSELEPWSGAHSQPTPMTQQEPDFSGVPRYRPNNNNAFHPGRYFRTSLSYPQRKVPDPPRPSPRGYVGASLSDSMHRQKVITIIKNGPKPRNSIKIFLNKRSMQSYEQVVADISEAFGCKLKTNKVCKIFTVRGREVQGVSDFFRGDDYFIAFCGGEILTENEVMDILEELLHDAGLAKKFLMDWRKNEKRRRKISPANRFLRSNRDSLRGQAGDNHAGHVPDKRDSGFCSDDISARISESEGTDRRVNMQKMNVFEKGREAERMKSNEADRKMGDRRLNPLKLVKPVNANKGVNVTDSDDLVRLKFRRRSIQELDGKISGDKRISDSIQRRGVNSYQNKANGLSHAAVEMIKPKIEQNTERQQSEDLCEDMKDLEEPLVKVIDNEAEEKHKTETELDTKTGVDKIENKENNKVLEIKDVCNPKPDSDRIEATEEISYVVNFADHKSVNNKEVQHLSTETVPRDTSQIEKAASMSEYVSQPADTKDTNKSNSNNNNNTTNNNNNTTNINNLKEKRKQDREDQQQRKRVKTKIIRKTKIERQVSSDEYVSSLYEMGRKLGDGNFAVVRYSRKKDSGHEFAIKVIDKAKLKGKNHMVENEIEILKECCHQNIVRLYEEYETVQRIYLVMELVKGGDLFDAITQNVKFREVDAALMVKDLGNALFYLHSRNIVHRDLKPENLLVYRNKDSSITLKLADFGLAMEVKQLIYTVCGTPTYVAPEILTDIGYGLEVDMWAVGVITYILLCGFPPFRSPDRNQTELFGYIKAGDFEFLSPYWDNTSRNAKDLISHLLVVDRKKRYTATDVLCHKWILCGGRVDVVPEGALTVDSAVRQTRRELDVQAKLNFESYQRVKDKRKQAAMDRQEE